jgi:hypothetical protein
MEILQSTIPQMNELVRLTEALRGNYTLDDDEYGEWNDWSNMRDEVEEEQFMREQRIIRRQLRELGMEANSELVIDEELEQRHDALISRVDSVGMAEGKCESDDREEGRIQCDMRKQKNKSNRSNDSVGNLKQRGATLVAYIKDTEKQSTRSALERIERELALSDTTSIASDALPKKVSGVKKRPISGESNASRKKKPKKEHVPRKDPPENTPRAPIAAPPAASAPLPEPAWDHHFAAVVQFKGKCGVFPKSGYLHDWIQEQRAASLSPERIDKLNKLGINNVFGKDVNNSATTTALTLDGGKNTASAARASAAAPSRPIKKCHHCKESTARHRRCAYWQVTGTKCGKVFCVECLSSNSYSLGNDVLSKDNPNGIPIEEILLQTKYDSEWHCPSCLKICKCIVCVKQRQAEEERERNQQKGSRRSGRRSAF